MKLDIIGMVMAIDDEETLSRISSVVPQKQ